MMTKTRMMALNDLDVLQIVVRRALMNLHSDRKDQLSPFSACNAGVPE